MSNDTAAIVCASVMGAFFACFFGYLLWKTRARSDSELDRVYTELAIAPAPAPSASRSLGGMRSVVRVYIVLGAIVTAWAAAVPFVLRRARESVTAVLGPLGLQQNGSVIAGERHGRRVSIDFTASGSVTRVGTGAEPIVVRRQGHEGASWLLDLREAETLAADRER